MEQLFTHGRWRVKRGSEDHFVSEWERLAEWGAREMPGRLWAVLLRDRDNPSQFFSFGPWQSLSAIEEFRDRPEFQAALARMWPLLEDVEVFTLNRVATHGPTSPDSRRRASTATVRTRSKRSTT